MPRFQVNPLHDKPVSEAVLLGHDEIVKALKNFLESNSMITPLSIAIHGDWGSGKTSVMRTLERQLDSERITVVFFEPWKYENADPPLALVQTIIQKLYKNSPAQNNLKSMGSALIKIAANAISQKYIGTNITDVVDSITYNVKNVESFSDELEKIVKNELGNNKLLIIIDDLDRCDVENTLLILSIMKLFFEIENCICIAAVDFNRLQQAWRAKYKISDDSDEGKEYLEKIFQIRIALPKPNNQQIREYVEELVPEMDDQILDLFSILGPKNPRAVKRLLNIISFRASLLHTDFAYDVSTLWSLLEHSITNKNLVYLQTRLQRDGGNIASLIINATNERVITQYISMMKQYFLEPKIPNVDVKLKHYLTFAHAYVKKHNIILHNFEKHFTTLNSLTNEEVE